MELPTRFELVTSSLPRKCPLLHYIPEKPMNTGIYEISVWWFYSSLQQLSKFHILPTRNLSVFNVPGRLIVRGLLGEYSLYSLYSLDKSEYSVTKHNTEFSMEFISTSISNLQATSTHRSLVAGLLSPYKLLPPAQRFYPECSRYSERLSPSLYSGRLWS